MATLWLEESKGNAQDRVYMMKVHRLIIYPKDIQRITGKTDRHGRLLIKKIKEHLKKDPHQYVTFDEFCAYTGLKIEQVTERLLQ